ncbi:FimV/HubP family polar landmark protein [Shewanella oncorhynchi]|uniref:FimV/HubP family polar landmark protein n=1 Tax=Shewanella TaxID=22 RepID=UPI0021DA6BBD|nr:FimV/HubP family polar landmark protein [Shewanella sp. SM69]MCU8041223.1 fimbrial protein FimV [Shewanella sp. SM69]
MANIVKSLGLLALVCSAPSMAQVSHVSINSRMFELGAYPKLRVNVIADNQDMSRLEFVVQQASGEERLMVEEINRFLVLLTGVEDVKDSSAKLLVREYRLDRWYDVKSINLFGGAKPASAALTTKAVSDTKKTTIAGAPKSADKVGIKPVKVVAESKPLAEVTPAATAANTQSKVPTVEVVTGFRFPEAANKQNTSATEINAFAKTSETIAVEKGAVENAATETVVPEIVKTANNEQKQNIAETASQTPEHCQLTYLAGETLWRIANRYAKDWGVSVYGAMLAIYEANPVAFSKNRINALKSNAVLSCPSKMILDQHSDAKEARAVFEAKEAGK